MRQLLRRLRGAAGLSLLWAAAGIGVGGFFELIDNVAPGALPFIARLDMWPQTMALVFFLGALVFTALVGIVERNRRLEELSLPRFAGWGALAGLLLGVALGAPPLFLGITTAGSSIAAAGSLALARVAEKRARLGGGAGLRGVQGGDGEVPARLGRKD